MRSLPREETRFPVYPLSRLYSRYCPSCVCKSSPAKSRGNQIFIEVPNVVVGPVETWPRGVFCVGRKTGHIICMREKDSGCMCFVSVAPSMCRSFCTIGRRTCYTEQQSERGLRTTNVSICRGGGGGPLLSLTGCVGCLVCTHSIRSVLKDGSRYASRAGNDLRLVRLLFLWVAVVSKPAHSLLTFRDGLTVARLVLQEWRGAFRSTPGSWTDTCLNNMSPSALMAASSP